MKNATKLTLLILWDKKLIHPRHRVIILTFTPCMANRAILAPQLSQTNTPHYWRILGTIPLFIRKSDHVEVSPNTPRIIPEISNVSQLSLKLFHLLSKHRGIHLSKKPYQIILTALKVTEDGVGTDLCLYKLTSPIIPNDYNSPNNTPGFHCSPV